MKDYAAIFGAFDSLPKKVRHAVQFAAVMYDVEDIATLYRRAKSEMGEKFAINWLIRSIQANDDRTGRAILTGAPPLRFREAKPPREPRGHLRGRRGLPSEVREFQA